MKTTKRGILTLITLVALTIGFIRGYTLLEMFDTGLLYTIGFLLMIQYHRFIGYITGHEFTFYVDKITKKK